MKEKVNIDKLSPMMKQYFQVKEQYKDCILFYRLGDFYELFYDDAVEISRVLDLTLTGKNCGDNERAPMCGVPYHAADGYIAKLIAKGYQVAICEQLSNVVVKGQKTVDREVVRVVTPGTVVETSMLDENRNNFLMFVYLEKDVLSVVHADISTGDLFLSHFKGERESLKTQFTDLLSQVSPAQVIGNKEAKLFYESLPVLTLGGFVKFEECEEYTYSLSRAKSNVLHQFGDNAVTVFELKQQDICAVGGLLDYIQETQKRALKNLTKISRLKTTDFMTIDINTRRNLELVESIREHKRYGSLLWLLDATKTSMGARKFRIMFDQPLQNIGAINERLDSVEELSKNLILRDRLGENLSMIRDIERICGRISYGNALQSDLISLKQSLMQIPEIKKILANVKSKKLASCRDGMKEFPEICDLLEKAIVDKSLKDKDDETYIIKTDFNEDLSKLRHAKETAKEECRELERIEREKTGIKNLRIDFNNVAGFYIEVLKSQTHLVPLHYVRKATLTNAERYITPDLKEIESKILTADEEAAKLEDKLYKMILEYLNKFLSSFLETGKAIAEIDALLSLANVAVKYNFTRPVMNKNTNRIYIQEGRHPIVEKFMKDGGFISNDTLLDSEENKMCIITGPNMAGKSTYMRQVALITFMAHIGSFVPAKMAEIALTDRIFTRVGASDDLAFGQSTFMVEMSEVATILANATKNSLVVLDEIGRGTSTFDGLSIAWAVVEYITQNLSCKTLFATHYHELSELEGVLAGVKNYKSTVKELGDSVVFLHKIVRGYASRSFGIEVAKIAGVPEKVISRAKEISANLEKVNQKLDMNIFGQDEERQKQQKESKKALKILSELKDFDINRMSPIESFEILNDLIAKAKEE